MYWVRCGVCTMIADFGGAVKYLGESVQIGRELNLKEQLVFGLTHMANTLTFMTHFEEAWPTAQEALQLAEAIGNRRFQAEVLAFPIAFYHLRNGDLDAASQTAEEGVRIAAKIGAAYPEDIGAYLLGYIAQARGEYENAIAHYQHSLQAGRTSGIPFLEMLPLGALGSAYLDVSEAFLDRVAEYHTRAVQLMANPTSNSSAGMVWADMGFCILSRGDLDHAQEFFRKGLTVPTPQGLLNRPRFLIGSALVALARNQVDEAAGLVDEARTFAEERAMKHLYPLVALAEAQVRAACGDAQRALENFARAEALALELQMRPLVGLARVEAAKIMSALGRESDAEAKWQGARAMIEEIANLFEDAAMRALYVENASGKIMLQTSEVLKTWIVQPD
jgi:tetratricopeptide (TPR) repeat protein